MVVVVSSTKGMDFHQGVELPGDGPSRVKVGSYWRPDRDGKLLPDHRGKLELTIVGESPSLGIV
jgi:hypothetical protein